MNVIKPLQCRAMPNPTSDATPSIALLNFPSLDDELAEGTVLVDPEVADTDAPPGILADQPQCREHLRADILFIYEQIKLKLPVPKQWARAQYSLALHYGTASVDGILFRPANQHCWLYGH